MTLTWTLLARLVLIASLPLLILPRLPTGIEMICLAALAITLSVIPCRLSRVTSIWLFLLLWMSLDARQSVQRLTVLTQAPVNVVVQLDEVRLDRQQIKVQILRLNNHFLFPPQYAWLQISDMEQDYCPGQHWQMQLRLRAVHARLNEGAFDAQRFAVASHSALQGKILTQQSMDSVCSWRWRFIQHHQPVLEKLPSRATLEALAFGIRDNLSEENRQLLRDTGTAHLMAISGMHIALAAGAGWLFARALQRFLPARAIGFLFPLWLSWLIAALYCWLSGSHEPAQRALLAVTLWNVSRIASVQLNSWQIWTCCLAILLFIDPLTVLSDSFWLSALAVAMLLLWYQWFPLPERFRHPAWFPLQLAHLQTGMMLLMAPLQVAIFKGISLTSLIANLLAVPLVSFITVPLILMALVVPNGSLSELCWKLADYSLNGLLHVLNMLPPGWFPLFESGVVLAVTWGGLILWRSGVGYVAPSNAGAAMAAIILWREPQVKQEWRIDMLDVGHGLAVVVSKGHHAILYDTGPRWTSDDAGNRIITPWLQYKRLKLEGIILSHKHLDHTGGLASLQQQWPTIPVRSAFDAAHPLPCHRGVKWQWQQLNFEVLWPLAPSVRGDNNDSCVVKIDDGKTSILLTGDIESAAERQLVMLEKQRLQASVIQVPHHGSRTSSSTLLLRTVSGQTAIASLARYNAWRMPAKAVLRNYHATAYKWLDTAQSGQINISVSRGKITVNSLREQILPRWYHEWFGVKRDSR